MIVRARYATFAAAFIVIVGLQQLAVAQSTIFNVPTTDTVSPKKVYVEFDYLPQIPKAEDLGRIQIFNPRVVAGLAPNLEGGANVPNTYNGSSPGLSSTTFSFVQPNIKYRFMNDNAAGIAAAAGLIWYTPINHRADVDSYGLVYANFSKKVKTSNYGPRITVGPYGIVGAVESYYGTKAGAIIGYEQPVHTKASIVADWFSGVSGLGYFTPGFSLTLPYNSVVSVGYSIGNDSYRHPHNHNRYLFIYYGITFP
jgi:hypothetical protein